MICPSVVRAESLISNVFDGEYVLTQTKIKAISMHVLEFLAEDKLSKNLCGVTYISVSDEKELSLGNTYRETWYSRLSARRKADYLAQ
jgi:hypothetical protein